MLECEKISTEELQMRYKVTVLLDRVPTRTRKMGSHFPVREKSGNFEQLENSGKITQNTGFQTNVICYFLVIFK